MCFCFNELARWYYVQALGNSQHRPVNGPTHFVSSKPYKPAPAASFCRTLPIPHPCDSPHIHSHSDGSEGGLNLHGGDGGASWVVNPVKWQARPQRPDPRAQLARLVGDVNPAAMWLELEVRSLILGTSLIEWPLFMASYALSQALPGIIWKDVGLVSQSEHYISRKLDLMLLSYTSVIASVYGTNFIILLQESFQNMVFEVLTFQESRLYFRLLFCRYMTVQYLWHIYD